MSGNARPTEFHVTQLGFRPTSHMRILVSDDGVDGDDLLVAVNSGVDRQPRVSQAPQGWASDRFPWPFDPTQGSLEEGFAPGDRVVVACRRVSSRWGDYFVGELPLNGLPGLYSLETARGLSLPFEVRPDIYVRLVGEYLDYTFAQRSGQEAPGYDGPLFLDDARRDSDGEQALGVGGWFDAGDHRHWTSTTVMHLGALSEVARRGPASWRRRAQEEVNWGRDYFLHLVDDEGHVPDNVGGGALPPGYDLSTWWFENHAGVACDNSGSVPSDDIPSTGDERTMMMHRNPHAENAVIRELAASIGVGPQVQSARCRIVAERVWAKSQPRETPQRTLFLASRLRAATALSKLPSSVVEAQEVEKLTAKLLARQDLRAQGDEGLFGYFLEEDGVDAYRSIPYSCEPAMALLDAIEVLTGDWRARAVAGVEAYVDNYLLADAASNPFGLPPYGVYPTKPDSDRQAYRDAGGGRGVRTFMAPWNRDLIAHGTCAVTMHQCYLMARAGVTLGRPDWVDAAERIMQWATGANPEGISLFMGIGYRHVVPFSPYRANMPGAVVNGHIGREDDTPYLETSNASNWNTQEVYGVPATYAAHAALWLDQALLA